MIIMASKVVSTKLTEEEYGKLVGLSSSTGFTVSKLLKKAILAKMNEERTIEQTIETPKPRETPMVEAMVEIPKEVKKRIPETSNQEERFLYY